MPPKKLNRPVNIFAGIVLSLLEDPRHCRYVTGSMSTESQTSLGFTFQQRVREDMIRAVMTMTRHSD
eukprot:981830-Amphidinium_carterae.1